MNKWIKSAIILVLLMCVSSSNAAGFIGNKQLRFGHNTWTTDKVLGLPMTATASLPAYASHEGALVYDATTNTLKFSTGSAWTQLASGVTTIAGCSDVTIASVASGHVLISSGSAWLNKAVSGDATLSAAGAVAVTDLSLTSEAQGDIAVRGASTWARLSAKGDGKILVGNGTTITSVSVSGDVTLDNAGATTVTDLTIASEAAGDVLYFNGTNWIRLAKPGASNYYLEGGTIPAWSVPSVGIASNLANNVTCEAGTYDYTLDFEALTTGATTIYMPDLANVDDTLVTIIKAQVLQGKTLTTPKIVTTGYIADAGGDEYLLFTESATPVNYIGITSADASSPPKVSAGGSDAAIDLWLSPKGTGNTTIGTGAASGVLESSGDFDLVLQTGNTTTGTITLTDGANGDLTFAPNGSGKFITGSGADAHISSNGAYNLVLETNDATNSSNITIVDAANGDVQVIPNGTGKFMVGNAADAYLSSIGAYDLILETNDGTNSGSLKIVDAANGDLIWTPNGTGKFLTGNGADAYISSQGAYNLVLETNDGTNSGAITIADAANGDITLQPNGTGQTQLYAPTYRVTTKTTTATLTEAEGGIILVNSTGGAFSITLPAAATSSGLWYTFKKIDAATNIVTLDGNASETIDGAATNTEIDAQFDYATIVCDGDEWHIINEDWH